MFAIIGACVFAIAIVLSVMISLGAPFGELTMGGQYKVFPKPLRILMLPQILLQGFGLKSILEGGGILPRKFSFKVTKIICCVYAVYFAFNTIMNLCSKSKKERIVSGTASAIGAICFGITALRMKEQ